MFTGIVQAIGRIEQLEPKNGDVRAFITTTFVMHDINLGDSIAVNGVCLTVAAKRNQGFFADISRETLGVTTLGGLVPGSKVHLEQALTLKTPLGGHLVSGHVDGLGKLLERRPDGRSIWLRFEFPQALARYIAPKGSLCLDGVSLTVNRVADTQLELNIVPHTLQETLLSEYREGHSVNLEVDLIARYLERLLHVGAVAPASETSALSEAFLARHGFISGS